MIVRTASKPDRACLSTVLGHDCPNSSMVEVVFTDASASCCENRSCVERAKAYLLVRHGGKRARRASA